MNTPYGVEVVRATSEPFAGCYFARLCDADKGWLDWQGPFMSQDEALTWAAKGGKD